MDIDLTAQRVPASAGDDPNHVVRDMLQAAAALPFGDWFEFTFGPPVMDSSAVTAVLATRSKLEWTGGSSPDCTWTPASVTWRRRPWKRSSAETGWDSLGSGPRRFG